MKKRLVVIVIAAIIILTALSTRTVEAKSSATNFYVGSESGTVTAIINSNYSTKTTSTYSLTSAKVCSRNRSYYYDTTGQLMNLTDKKSQTGGYVAVNLTVESYLVKVKALGGPGTTELVSVTCTN